MARTARGGYLETRSARLNKLTPRKKPYWARAGKEGVHLGYRRKKPRGKDANGAWIARRYIGASKYCEEVFAEADDFADADGSAILSYAQAVEKLSARASVVQTRRRYSVADAVADYLAALTLKSSPDCVRMARSSLDHYLIGFLSRDGIDGAQLLLEQLTGEHFKGWHAWALQNKPQRKRKDAPGALPPRPTGRISTMKKPEQERARNCDRTPAPLSEDELKERERARKERVNRVLGNVRAVLNKAYNDDKVGSAAAWKSLKKYEHTKKAHLRFLSESESVRLRNAAETDFRQAIDGGHLTGVRWSELRRIRACDYDRRAGTVRIGAAKRRPARHVYLNEAGRRAFDVWTAGLGPRAYVFTREDGTAWGKADQTRRMKNTCKAAGFDSKDRITFHTLRHSYASALVRAGVHLKIVATSLGHADTRMVEEHYGHLGTNQVADAIREHLPDFGVEVSANVHPLLPKAPAPAEQPAVAAPAGLGTQQNVA